MAGKTVLIVDDAAFMRMMVKDILTKNGFDVVGEAENGAKAVEKYSELNPDLTIMDITMPEMDGIEAVKAIKAINKEANVIMCSAMGQQAMVIESIQAGAKDFVVKPFQAERVIEAVSKVLGQCGGMPDEYRIAIILLLFCLIVVGFYYLSRWLGRWQHGRQAVKNIQIIEALYVGPQKSLQIVRVGKTFFLIAVSKTDIHLIKELEGSYERSDYLRSDKRTSSFAEYLKKMTDHNQSFEGRGKKDDEG